jgi:eukaryotic-like serine/threonine-protein kinase
MRTVRIFVSSPGDVDHERRRMERVVERLNGEFAEVAHLQTIRWETEFYRADKTFQAQIPEAAECDIVVAIFRGRIGTALPAAFATLPDGSPYPSGTAYEVLSAIAAARAKQLPDIYVFRNNDPPLVRLDDPEAARVAEQWQRLKAFFDTWFVGTEGPFKAAFHNFTSPDDFEVQVERLLRGWLEEKVLHGRAVLWPIAAKGSPFRGLEAFGAKHSAVFFGRTRDIARAVDLWKDAAERGSPFLIVVGASGSGKSSLARAGLMPRLTVPGVVPAVDAWRVAAMRPTELADGPIATLAARLLDGDNAVPEAESGRPPALPELAASDYRTPAELAALLVHADAAAVTPLLRALDRIGEELRVRQGYERPVRCDLVVLVDQLDELFGDHADAAERAAFAHLLKLFVESGRIWVIATLRADLYDRFLAEPDLLALKTAGASYDLAAPGPAELAEIVRKPAEAAELVFDRDSASGDGLDEVLLREADRPDMLPLLQLALNRLFEARVSAGSETRLTYAAFAALGGLSGIIDREAERAVVGLGESALAELPRLLRQLVTVTAADGGDSGSLTTRTVPIAAAAANDSARRLVDALVAARIFLVTGEGSSAGVQLAHQRVIADWHRARDLIAANQDFYRVRDEVEAQRRRWEAAANSRDRLIGRGVPLAEAESIAARFGDELSPETRAFIAASGRRARARQRFVAAAAVVFALLAVAASGAGFFAWHEEQRAARSLEAAKGAVSNLVFDIAQKLRNVQGMRAETIAAVLKEAQNRLDELTQQAPDDYQLRRLRAAALDEIAQTYLSIGDLDHARAAADDALATMRSLVAAEPQSRQHKKDLGVALDRLGHVALRSGDAAAALIAFTEDLAIARELVAADPGNLSLQRNVSEVLNNIGEAKSRTGDTKGAAAAYQEALTIITSVAAQQPDNAGWQRDLSVSLNRTGDISASAGDTASAAKSFDQALTIRRKLAAAALNDNSARHDLWFELLKIGDLRQRVGDAAGSSAAYTEALPLIQQLAQSDYSNAQWQLELADNLNDVGNLKLKAGDNTGATALYQQALTINRHLTEITPADLDAQRNLEISLDKLGNAVAASGDKDAALAAFNEALAIARKIADHEPANMVWQNDIALALAQLADLKRAIGDNAGAADLYNEAVTVGRAIAAAHPDDVRLERSIAVILNKLGDIKVAAGDSQGALATFQESLTLCRDLLQRASPGDVTPRADVAYTLWRIGTDYLRMSDGASALPAVQEAVTIRQAIATAAPDNLAAQREAINGTQILGDLQLMLKNPAGAAAAYRQAAAIARQLTTTAADPTEWQIDLVVALTKLATVSSGNERSAVLTEALSVAQTLQEHGKLTGTQTNWPDQIRAELAKAS